MTCSHIEINDEFGRTTVVCNDRIAGTTLILNPVEETLQRAQEIAAGLRGAPVRLIFDGDNESLLAELTAQGWKPTSLLVLEFRP